MARKMPLVIGLLGLLALCWQATLSAEQEQGIPWGTFAVRGYGSADLAWAEAHANMVQRLAEIETEIPPGYRVGEVEVISSMYQAPTHCITFRVWLIPAEPPTL